MYIIKEHPAFSEWFGHLKDRVTRIRLGRRLDQAARGNLGDIKSVGDGVFEMREFFGPGWRMYFIRHDNVIIVMLGGGDKSTQSADIAKAIKLATIIEE